jgi:hypothetical protein
MAQRMMPLVVHDMNRIDDESGHDCRLRSSQ